MRTHNIWLYPRHTKYAEGLYSFCRFRSSVRPSVFPSVRPSVHAFVRYNQVLLRSFLIMYISAATYQKLFIFGMGVPGRVLLHSTSIDPWAMPWGGASGQNLECLNKVVYFYIQVLLWRFLSISLQQLIRNYSYLVWEYLGKFSSFLHQNKDALIK